MVDSNQPQNRTLSLICPMVFTKRTLRDDEKEPVKMQSSHNVHDIHDITHWQDVHDITHITEMLPVGRQG